MAIQNPTVGASTHTPIVAIARVAKDAGFDGENLEIAVAVSLAENGSSDPTRVSPANSDGSRDYGLWQINSVHSELFDQNPTWWDPSSNARMAFSVFQSSRGWEAWTTYRSGAYRLHLGQARTAVKVIPAGPLQHEATVGEEILGTVDSTFDALVGIGNAIASIAQNIFKAGAWLADPHNWVRASLVALGGGLVVGALVMVAKPAVTPATQAIVKAVK